MNMLKNSVGACHVSSPGASGNQGVDGANLSMLNSKIDELVKQAISLTKESQRLQELKKMMDPHLINAHIPLSLSNALDAVLKDHEADDDDEELEEWLQGPLIIES